MTTQEKIEVMQASENGAEIESSSYSYDEWMPSLSPCWDWDNWKYRVKPKERTKLWFWLTKHSNGDKEIFSQMLTDAEAAKYPNIYIRRLDVLEFEYEEEQ